MKDLVRVAIILAILFAFLDAAFEANEGFTAADRATQAAVESARTMGQDR